MKNIFAFIWEIIKIVVIALVIVVPIRYFLFQPFFVKGQSMEPNFEDGNYLIVDEITYRLRQPERGEVIVFKYPNAPSQRYIKRIIGLPGETIEVKNGQVLISKDGQTKVMDESNYLASSDITQGNTKITLNNDQYFVMGDNRQASYDSRRWGPVPKENIIGRVYLRAWPFEALAKFEAPAY